AGVGFVRDSFAHTLALSLVRERESESWVRFVCVIAMEVTYLKAINQALHEEMRRDENVYVMGEDVAELGGAFKVTEGLLDAFGEDRVIDTPISEALIVGAGIGSAVLGMRPVLEMQFGDFISCAFDQIVKIGRAHV